MIIGAGNCGAWILMQIILTFLPLFSTTRGWGDLAWGAWGTLHAMSKVHGPDCTMQPIFHRLLLYHKGKCHRKSMAAFAIFVL